MKKCDLCFKNKVYCSYGKIWICKECYKEVKSNGAENKD